MKLIERLEYMNFADDTVIFECMNHYNDTDFCYDAYYIRAISETIENQKIVRDVLNDYCIRDTEVYKLYIFINEFFKDDKDDVVYKDFTILIGHSQAEVV